MFGKIKRDKNVDFFSMVDARPTGTSTFTAVTIGADHGQPKVWARVK
jgi:hypothetical protein